MCAHFIKIQYQINCLNKISQNSSFKQDELSFNIFRLFRLVFSKPLSVKFISMIDIIIVKAHIT